MLEVHPCGTAMLVNGSFPGLVHREVSGRIPCPVSHVIVVLGKVDEFDKRHKG
jgi:hypothetical protein